MQRLGECFRIGFDLRGVIAFEAFFQGSDGVIDFFDFSSICFVAEFFDRLFRLVDQCFRIVLGFDAFLAFLIFFFMRFCVVLHLLDLFIREAGGRGDIDLLFLAGAEVFCRNVDDAVCIDVEGDLNLRYAPWSRRDVGEFKAAEGLVVRCHRTFALQDMNVYRWLIVSCGGENLRLGGRDGGISLDHGREDTAQGLDTEGQRGDIEEKDVLDFAFEDAGLNSSADSDGFIRVHTLGWFLAEFILDQGLYCRDTGRTADKKDFIDITDGKACILHRKVDRFYRRLYEVFGDSIKFCAGQGRIEVDRLTIGVDGDEWQVDIRTHDGGQLDLGFFACFLQSLVRHRITFQFEAVLCFEFFSNPVHDAGIEIITAEMAVAVGGFDFEDAIRQIQDGYIESAAAEVIDEEAMFFAVFDLIEAVSQRGCGRFVDDTKDIQPCDLAGILGRLALCIGEISRAGDDCIGDFFTEIRFCIDLQLLQDHRRNFLRSIGFVINGDFVVAAHVTFDGNDGAMRVRYRLAFCQLADQTFTGLGEADNRWGQARTFRIRNDDRLAAFHDGNNRVCSPQIDTNNF